jgi:hypothetical protein
MRLMTPVVSTLLALCVPFAGWMYDRSGSYDGAWLVLAAAMLVLGIVTLRVPVGTATNK